MTSATQRPTPVAATPGRVPGPPTQTSAADRYPGPGDRRAVARPVARGGRRRGGVRHSGRHDPARLRPTAGLHEGPARPRPARAGRRPRRHRVRAGHRQGRGLHGDLRAWRDQPRHPARRRQHGLRAGRRDHRPAVQGPDRHRRVPGSRHLRHHAAVTKHNFLVKRPRGHPAHDRRGVPHREHRPTRPRARGHPQGRAAGDHLILLAARDAAARLQADDPAARQAGPRGREAGRAREAAGVLRRRRRAQGRGVAPSWRSWPS